MNNIKKLIFKTQTDQITSFSFNFSTAKASVGLACGETTFPLLLYSPDSIIVLFSRLYTDSGLSTLFLGGNNWYKMGTKAYQISNIGEVIAISVDCSTTLPLTRYCYKGIYTPPDPIHIPPGGVVNYEDEFGNPQERDMITTESGIVNIYSSSVPTFSACTLVDCDTGNPI